MPPKPRRYFPGQAPAGLAASSDSEDSADEQQEQEQQQQKPAQQKLYHVVSIDAARITAHKPAESEDLARRPRRRASSSDEDDEDGEKDKEDVDRHRARLRALALQSQADDADTKSARPFADSEQSTDDSESDDDGEESEEESSEEEAKPLFKPVFIPKARRETVLEKQRAEAEQELAAARKKEEDELRRLESKKLVEEAIKQELVEAKRNDAVPDIDDTDGVDEEEEFEAWRLRELRRVRRDRLERIAHQEAEADIERRRNMTDAEIAAEDAGRNDKGESQFRFMQKYFHKGAFYQDDEILVKRDYAAPTEAERVDRSALPEVMQVKNFGKAGRTKWTHLTNEDTTRFDAGWVSKDEAVAGVTQRMLGRLGGLKGASFDKPTAKKQKRN